MLTKRVVQFMTKPTPLALSNLGNFFFKFFPCSDFLAQRHRAVADSAFKDLMERFQAGEQPNDDKIQTERDERIPHRSKSVRVNNPSCPVAHEPTRDAQDRNKYTKWHSDIPEAQ